MKTRDILIVGGLALLGYYWWMKSKKPVTTEDLTNKKPLGSDSGAAPTQIPAVDVTLKQPLMANDFGNKNLKRGAGKRVRVKNKREVLPPAETVEKKPIFVQRDNAVPNTYSDNIGLPVERPTLYQATTDYQNFMGSTTSIQCACRQNAQRTQRYRSNLPQLP